MSVDYNVSVLTARLQEVAAAIDASGNGNMRFLDSGGNVLSTLQLPTPMGSAAGGVLTFAGMSLVDPAAAASGTATRARIEDGAGTIVISGLTVNDPSGISDIYLTPTNVIVAGQTIAITAASITGN